MNEYSSLKDSILYSWAALSPGSFFLRLGGLWLVTFTVLGAPISAASFGPSKVGKYFNHFFGRYFVVLFTVVPDVVGFSICTCMSENVESHVKEET